MKAYKAGIYTGLLSTLLVFFVVVYTACKKNTSSPTANNTCGAVTCTNGAACINGSCVCLSGFESDDCSKRSIERYLGKWDIQETITGSSEQANKGQTRQYFLTIKEVGGSNVNFLMDNFMGKGTANGIKGSIGLKYNILSNSYEGEIPTQFVIRDNQNVPGTPIAIRTGLGTINSLGSNITGRYYISYAASTGIVYDTVSFSGIYVQ